MGGVGSGERLGTNVVHAGDSHAIATVRQPDPANHGLFGIVAGEYLPIWPVYVVGFDAAALIC